MASTSSSAQEQSEPLRIQINTIRILLNTNAQVSDKLFLSVKDPEKAKANEKKTSRIPKGPQDPELLYEWKLREHCVAFPKDSITVISYFSRTRTRRPTRKKIDEFKFDAEAVFASCLLQSGSIEYKQVGSNSTLFLGVTLHGLSSTQIPELASLSEIDTLGDEIDRLAASSLSDDTMSTFQSVFGSIADNVNVEVLGEVVKALKAFAVAHPFVNIVFKVLLIPYEMLKQQHEFMEDLKTLANDMCTSLKSMANAFRKLELKCAQDSTKNLLRVIVKASKYVNDFFNKGGISRLGAAQFRHELDEYKKTLQGRRLDFREAVLVQLLINSGDLMAQENHIIFLGRKLKPADQPAIDAGCLDGTRKTVLADVKDWLANSSVDVPNVLWVSGAPGAGKTAVASTIVNILLRDKSFESYDCAKFFIKRAKSDLRNPRKIWRSIAFQLVEMHRDVKVEILDVMTGKSGRTYPEDAKVEDQFGQLICEPLKRLITTRASSQRIVVVIDALDECDMGNKDEWRAFLDSIVKWSKDLPTACKLVITGRIESEIEEKLRIISHPLILDTGDHVTDESRDDIRRFFEAKLEVKDGVLGSRADVIAALTRHAAGLFVWATTVVAYVNQKNSDLKGRLEAVLDNMAKIKVKDDYIGGLYAQILFASSADLNPRELNSMSLVLASLVLLKEQLPKKALLALLAPKGLESRSLDSIISIVESLKSVIVIKGDGVLRVRHKSFSDFLQNYARVKPLISTFFPGRDTPEGIDLDHDGILTKFSLPQQSALLAEGCLCLMNNVMDICAAGAFPEVTALMYSCCHWVHHQGASASTDGHTSGGVHLVPTIKTFPSLQEYALRWMEVLSGIRKASDQLDDSFFSNDASSVLQNMFGSIADGETATVLKALTTFATAHPIINIVYEALKVPNKLCEGEDKVIADLRTLASGMCTSLTYMMNTFFTLGLESDKGLASQLLNVIVKTSKYTVGFVNRKGDISAQFRDELDGYRRSLQSCHDVYRETIFVKNLVSSGILKDRGDDIPFLRHQLESAKQPPTDGGCLEGTRDLVLSDVEAWLKRSDGLGPNVLWVSGAAGAGKTALASTIVAKVLKNDCVKFFIKSREASLRDPRIVWRSVAFELAKLHRGFKVQILDAVSGRSYGANHEHAKVGDQFRELICEPLKTYFASPTSSQNIVIVIDALDECDEGLQREFLETIVEWSKKLPQACKLLVTSRPEPEIEKKLKDVSHQLFLDTGDVVSKESSYDIQCFLEAEFEAIREKAMEVGDLRQWPEPEVIANLTNLAAGTFVWARTVIDFVGESGNPIEQLKEVLINLAEVSNGDLLGGLYGQIVFIIASRLRLPIERNSLSLVLASVIQLKDTLPKKILLQLLAPDDLPSRSLPSIVAASDSLRSVITTEGDDKALRGCHRSFSEFLLNETRIQTSIKSLPDTASADCESILLSLSHSHQNALLAEGCLWLMNHTLEINIFGGLSSLCCDNYLDDSGKSSVANIPASLEYACQYWMAHLQDAVMDMFNDLAPLIMTFIERHNLDWVKILNKRDRMDWEKSVKDLMLVADYMKDFDKHR